MPWGCIPSPVSHYSASTAVSAVLVVLLLFLVLVTERTSNIAFQKSRRLCHPRSP